MSASSIIFLLSPVPTLDVLGLSRAEVPRCRSGVIPGLIRGQKDSGVPKPRNRVAAKAGIGRYSGAVHGHSQRGRRRRPPVEPDNPDDNSNGDEPESIHDDGKGLDVVEEIDSELAVDPTDSYQRYLGELGINEQNDDKEYHEAVHNVEDGTSWIPIGAEGDLGYRQADNGAMGNNVDEDGKQTELREAEGAPVLGGDGFAQEDQDKNKVKDNSKSGRGRRTRNARVNPKESTVSRSESDSAAETVTNSAEVDKNVDPARSQGDLKLSPPVQPVDNVKREGNGTLISSKGGAIVEGRKQRRKARMKSGVNAEPPDVERQVRVVENGAEQPSVTEALFIEPRRDRGKKDNDLGRTFDQVTVDRKSSVMAVNVTEEREESSMVSCTCETEDSLAPADEYPGVPVPLGQSVAVISTSVSESANVCEEQVDVLHFVGSEHNNEVAEVGSENVHERTDTLVIGSDVTVQTTNNAADGIQLQTRIVSSLNSTSLISESGNTITVSSNGELLAGNLPSVEEVPDAAAVGIGEEPVSLMEKAAQVVSKAVELPVQVVTKVVEIPSQVANKVVDSLPADVANKVVELPAQVANTVVELPSKVVDQATQVGTLVAEQVTEILPDSVTEQVGQVVSHMVDLQAQFSNQVSNVTDEVLQVTDRVLQDVQDVTDEVLQAGQLVMDQVSEAGESVVDQVTATAEQVANFAESVTSTANQVVEQVTEAGESVVEQVTTTAEQVANFAESVTSTANQVAEQVADKVTDMLSFDDDYDDSDSDDEFEAYVTTDDPAFRGSRGLNNFVIIQENEGVLAKIYDFYTYMLKQPMPKFATAMFSAPIGVSMLFTLLYLPEYQGLAFDDTARDFFAATDGDALTLNLSWRTLFQVFMFSLSLSTGLEPELAPLSPYTLVIANLNSLVAQLVFVFLSGAVFARLSQPAQPVRCSSVILVSTSPAQRKKEVPIKVLMTRYVLAGPQPCELVDVKVDLTYKYNTFTRTGSYFRATQSLKLVRPEISFLTQGMLVRHVIDSTSPLYQRTQEMLKKEDAVFSLSVVGLERSSMQSVFHVQHYCVSDDDVVWDAEFEDMILVNSSKKKRLVDHSRLSMWRPLA
ncbi:hypothetical protein R1sor_013920 [Riccia sorocarpa]|uniref:Inward rectifier potassium channel C-terminal domain-containing protein n=1 Tax=Riccia sorocarpa TaxID=122646 RepID=A0ABD3HC27_9MARC